MLHGHNNALWQYCKLKYIKSLLASTVSDSCSNVSIFRFMTAHIWACPPSEVDGYIFHSHPPEQKIQKPKELSDWYRKMLDTAKEMGVIYDYKVPPIHGTLRGSAKGID